MDELDNQDLIEAMMAEADPALEPGLQQGSIVHPGDTADVDDEERLPPMVATTVSSAGYVRIYERKTGNVSLTNKNMLPAQLAKRTDDGQIMFSRIPPKDKTGRLIQPPIGQFCCRLHPNDSERALFDQMGLGTCQKATLLNPFQVTQHMAKRHRAEWDAIQQYEKTKREEEERALQLAILKSAARGLAIDDDQGDERPAPKRGRPAGAVVTAGR